MEWIECATQEELDREVAAGNGAIVSQGHFVVGGSANVRAWDSATVEASDSATVRAWDSATVRAWDSATVRAWDSATVEASGSVTVEASDSVTVEASGSATVEASGSVTVEAWDFATVKASDSVTVEASDSTTVQAWGSAIVYLFARAVARIMSSAVAVHAKGGAMVILHVPVDVVATETVTVIDRVIRSVETWAMVYGAKRTQDDRLVLFKWVQTDGTSGYGTQYIAGEVVTANDWDSDPERECGGGLHACASLADARKYKPSEEALAVELWVDPADCRVPLPTDTMPEKIRFCTAYVARVWNPENESSKLFDDSREEGKKEGEADD